MPRKHRNLVIPKKPPVKQEMMEQTPTGMAMRSEPASKPPKREKISKKEDRSKKF